MFRLPVVADNNFQLWAGDWQDVKILCQMRPRLVICTCEMKEMANCLLMESALRTKSISQER